MPHALLAELRRARQRRGCTRPMQRRPLPCGEQRAASPKSTSGRSASPGVVVLHDAVLAALPVGAVDSKPVRGRIRLQLWRMEPRAGAGVMARARSLRGGQPLLRVSDAAARSGAGARRRGSQSGCGARGQGTCAGARGWWKFRICFRSRDAARLRLNLCATGSGWAWTRQRLPVRHIRVPAGIQAAGHGA